MQVIMYFSPFYPSLYSYISRLLSPYASLFISVIFLALLHLKVRIHIEFNNILYVLIFPSLYSYNSQLLFSYPSCRNIFSFFPLFPLPLFKDVGSYSLLLHNLFSWPIFSLNSHSVWMVMI